MIFRDDALASKHIFISGASSGIGREAAITMASCGARISLCGRDEVRLEETRSVLRGDGHRIFSADFGRFDEAHDVLVAASKPDDPFQAVFHSAGVASLRIAKLYNQEHVENVFAASVTGAMAIAKACAKRKVLDDSGSIIFMSSVAGIRGRAGMGGYAASKAAIGGLTRALAAEFAARHVRVNEIVSGAVETPMHGGIVKNLDEAGEKAYADLHLLGFGQAKDVANVVTFLASDASVWITGASLAVDGGYSAI